MHFMKITLTTVTNLLNKIVKLLVAIVAVSLLLGIIFGTSSPFLGEVYKNVADILSLLGEDALLALVSLIIILTILKKG